MAAVQLARHLGAEVFATASPGKWDALRAPRAGRGAHRLVADDRVRGARSARRPAGRGVDVVLDSLAGEFVDASLRLTGARRPVHRDGQDRHPRPGPGRRRPSGGSYQAFDLMEAGPDRIAAMLAALGGLFADGALAPLPVACWDVRRAREAFRYLSQARHIGKLVLTIPAPDGGRHGAGDRRPGALGGLVARHLAARTGGRRPGAGVAPRPGRAGGGRAGRGAGRAGRGCAGGRRATSADRQALAAVLAAVPAWRR